jgi:hypothetical protein
MKIKSVGKMAKYAKYLKDRKKLTPEQRYFGKDRFVKKDKLLREGGKPLKPVKNILFVGRRWFDKVNGNTYHTTEVYVNGKFVSKSERTYGYGSQYEVTGFEILQDAGYFPKTGKSTASGYSADFSYFGDFKWNNPNAVSSTVSDVKRRSDL